MKPKKSRFSTAIHLDASQPQGESWNEVIRIGNWSESYKQFEVTSAHLTDFVKNFKANVVKYSEGELPVNYAHLGWEKAAGWIEDMKVEGNSLLAKIRWTPAAKQAITDEEFKYFSAEIDWEYTDQETKERTNNVFTGLALTNIPFVSDMAAAMLAKGNLPEGDPAQIFNLSIEQMKKFKELLAGLTAKDKVSAKELAKLQGAFLMLDDTQQAEVKEEVEAVETKVEEEKPTTEGENGTENKGDTQAADDMRSKLAAAQAEASAANSKADKLATEMRRRDEVERVRGLINCGKMLPKDETENVALLMSLPADKANQVFLSWEKQPAALNFKELGGGGGDDGDKETQLDARVKELQKDNPNLSYGRGVKLAVKENPALAPKL